MIALMSRVGFWWVTYITLISFQSQFRTVTLSSDQFQQIAHSLGFAGGAVGVQRLQLHLQLTNAHILLRHLILQRVILLA